MVGGVHCERLGGARRQEPDALIFGTVDPMLHQRRDREKEGIGGHPHQGAVQSAIKAEEDNPPSSMQGPTQV